MIPVLYKRDVVVVFCRVLDHHPHFAPHRIEGLLLLYLAPESHVHAVVVLFDELVEVLFGLLVLLQQ